ncbi:MAG: amidohydrolase [Acidobacteriota bacterium]|nr:amidohydrolase [Acidobacteriota bacterium]
MMGRRPFLFAAGASMTTLAAPLSYRIIDPHVHVWKHDPEYPFSKGEKAPAEDRTPGMLLELMKANGVSKTVIIQVRHYMFDNSYLASVLKEYPGTFQGVARVNPESPDAPDDLSELTAQGFRGIRISPAAGSSGDWIEGPLMPRLWKRCEQLGVPMTIYAPIGRMPAIGKLADQYPDLTVVIDHMADCPVDQPRELEKLIALKRRPKLFVKVSHTWQLSKQRYPWLDAQELVKRLHAAFGPERLMWATDWPVCLPHATYEQTLRVVRDDMPFLNAEDKHWMLSKTVERVWPFGDA